MTNERAALGGMLEELVDLGVIEFCSEPFDAIVERRLKTVWTSRACPNCDADTLNALDGSARIWCGRCDWKTTYTRGTPFYESELALGEFLIAFLLSPCYKTLHDRIRELETAFIQGVSDRLGAHLPDSRWADAGR